MIKASTILLLAAVLVMGLVGCESASPAREATATIEPVAGDQDALVEAGRVDLAKRLDIDTGDVTVDQVSPTQFRDSCLEIEMPGGMCAQVITPGYIITLSAGGQSYRYHASGSRVILAAEGSGAQGSLTIEAVRVDAGAAVTVRGISSLPDGSCLNSELWADGVEQAWWPGDECVPVEEGAWQMVVPLDTGGAPAELDPEVQYMLRVFLRGGPDISATFPFDLAGPPVEAP